MTRSQARGARPPPPPPPPLLQSLRSSSPSSSACSARSSSPPTSPRAPHLMARVEQLRYSVQQFGVYDEHAQLVHALRELAQLHELREARERFARAHPLDPAVWLLWLEDELSVADCSARRVALMPLFERALGDFLHVPLHRLYLRSVLALWREHAVDVAYLQRAFERSVRLGAIHHFTEGESLWRLYQHVSQHFNQPLTLEQPCYQSHASELAAQFSAFEAKISDAQSHNDPESLTHLYTSYATFVNHSHPLASISVYERMLTANFSHPAAWLHYLSYLATLPDKRRLASVADRAVRNVPKCIPVWSHAVLAAQYHQNPVEKLSKLIERAEPFVITSEDYAAAEALSKHAWSVFLALDAPQQLLPRLNQSLSFNVMLSVHWASAACFAATVLAASNHVQSAIQLFESVINARPTETRWRLQFANAISSKSQHSVRDMFQQGMLQLTSPTDANILRDAWQAFEVSIAAEGTLLDRLRHIDAISAKRANPSRPVGRDEDTVKKRSKKRRDRPQTPKKQKLRTSHQPEQPHSATVRNETNAGTSDAANDAHKMEDVEEQNAKQPAQPAAANGSRTKHKGGKDGTRTRKVPENANVVDDTSEPNTIFVSNLRYNVKEEDLRQFFGDAGPIRQIRLPLRSDGAPKGIAYIEFEEDEGVQSALAKHLQAIHGRTVSVKRSKPPQKKMAGKKSRASSSKRHPFQARGSGSRKVVISGIRAPDKDVDMTDNVEGSAAKDEAASDQKPMNQDDFRAMLKG